MPGVNSFDKNVQQYEEWFVNNPFAYVSELHAVKKLLPTSGNGIEIGMGTGRFSAPFGIRQGIEPSRAMAEVAKKKGLDVTIGVAENLPYKDSQFDFCLMVTTVCFLDDIDLAFKEAYRVLKPHGPLIIGFVDKNSPIGRLYEQRKNESQFYKAATFYSVDDLLVHLKKAGFVKFRFCQTLFGPLQDMQGPSEVKEGFGEGSFVVIRAEKSEEGKSTKITEKKEPGKDQLSHKKHIKHKQFNRSYIMDGICVDTCCCNDNSRLSFTYECAISIK